MVCCNAFCISTLIKWQYRSGRYKIQTITELKSARGCPAVNTYDQVSVETSLTWKILGDFEVTENVLIMVLFYLYMLWDEESEIFLQTKAQMEFQNFFN